jgi:hypothetical protein
LHQRFRGVVAQLVFVNGAPRRLRNAVSSENGFGHRLVHCHCGPEHAATHVGDVGQLQQSLHRAVFAHRAVQERQHHRRRGVVMGERRLRLRGLTDYFNTRSNRRTSSEFVTAKRC